MVKKIKILHVDDSQAVVMYTKKMLTGILSIEMIESAGTISEAKNHMNSKEVNIAILDINLPDGNGLSLLRWIKECYPDVLIIMLTSDLSAFYREYVKKLGVDYCLDKSMEFEEIIRIIENQ